MFSFNLIKVSDPERFHKGFQFQKSRQPVKNIVSDEFSIQLKVTSILFLFRLKQQTTNEKVIEI